MDRPSYQAFRFSTGDDGKHSISPPSSPLSLGLEPPALTRDTTYSQHLDDPTPESNPAGNPTRSSQDMIHYAEKINRAQLLKNIDTLDNVDLVRLSRSSYLAHANRYRVRN
jgi:hypothetical protein